MEPGAKTALQLYTLRELKEQGMAATLESVAGIGFAGVELAGLTDLSAVETAAVCAALGLEVCGAHVGLERFESEPEAVAAELRILGTENLVIPWLPPDSEVVAAAARIAAATATARSLGLSPIFHNHWFEFDSTPAGRLWDALVAIDGLGLEIDLGWAWAAGEDPLELLRAHAGRCRLAHLKDMRRDGDKVVDTPLGEGQIDWAEILPVALETGVEWLIVEQDHPGSDPVGATRRSFDHLAGLLAAVPRGA